MGDRSRAPHAPTLHQNGDGYEHFACWAGDSDDFVTVHHLLAIAGRLIEPAQAFSGGDWHVHHKVPIPWLNVPSNLVAVQGPAHVSYTNGERRGRDPELDPPPRWVVDAPPFDVDDYDVEVGTDLATDGGDPR